MSEHDSTPSTLGHIQQVGTFMAEATAELVRRASRHDHSKLEPNEKPVFDRETPLLQQLEYGSEEYNASLERLGSALQHHYLVNSHHPEHYAAGIAGMDLFDLVEMVADWKAAAMRQKGGNEPSVDYNVERFGIDPQLAEIIRNTLDRWPRSE